MEEKWSEANKGKWWSVCVCVCACKQERTKNTCYSLLPAGFFTCTWFASRWSGSSLGMSGLLSWTSSIMFAEHVSPRLASTQAQLALSCLLVYAPLPPFSTIFFHLSWHLSPPQPTPSFSPLLIFMLVTHIPYLCFSVTVLHILRFSVSMPNSILDDFLALVKVTLPKTPIRITMETGSG